MLLAVEHKTELTYSDAITETVMEVRVTPLTNGRQTLRAHRIDVGPSATLLTFTDWLGNAVNQFSVLPRHDYVVLLARSVVETFASAAAYGEVRDPLGAPPENHRIEDFIRFSGPITLDPRLRDLVTALGIDPGGTTGAAMTAIAERLQDHITYKKGVTTSSTPLGEVLDTRAGVCQDLAHLSVAILRSLGVPARYVSGYVQNQEGPRELETHAWAEAYAPSVGWIGFDPTQRGGVTEGHIGVAVGRDFSDVPPNRGMFKGAATEAIAVTVTVEEVDEVPEGLLAPRTVSREPTRYAETPPVHREAIEYQQEQQQQ